MKKLAIALIVGLIIYACSNVPITGRKQLTLLPDSQMVSMGLMNYQAFLTENKTKVKATGADVEMVKRIGNKISKAVESYLTTNGYQDKIANYQWEFNVVDENVANAWCMPGGKVVVYTGLLPITQNETALACVMGHEIAHAIANHGNERMSQSIIAEVGMTGLDLFLQTRPQDSKNIFWQAIGTGAGVGTSLGLLKFSRDQESEADKMGLIFMAMAGYNPQESISFWERMKKMSAGQEPPQFLSTHPSNDERISDIKAYLPQALKYYKPM